MKVFPTGLMGFDGLEFDIERRTISGGAALSGDEISILTDGGGRVFAELSDPFMDDIEVALTWRALSAYMDGGSRPVIVPICDGRHQPMAGFDRVPHSDGATFSDETEYISGGATGLVTANAELRGTRLVIQTNGLSRHLMGGEWLSIDHPTARWRAYRIAEIFEQRGDAVTVSIRPPLREAVPAGADVDFETPRCVMRIEGTMRSPTVAGYAMGQNIRFVEDFTGNYS